MLGTECLCLAQWILEFHFGLTCYPPCSLSRLYLTRIQKSTLEALSSGAISSPKMHPDIRCMYISKVQVELVSDVKVFNMAGSHFVVLMD